MYESVLTVLDDFQSSWSVLPVFQGIRDDFQEKIAQLHSLDYQQRFITGQSSKLKKQIRQRAAEEALKMRGSLLAYAASAEVSVLYNAVSFAPSRLRYGSVMETTAFISLLIEKATEHLAALAPYGVDQNVLDNLIAARDAILEVSTEPRDRIVNRKSITRTIKTTVERMDKILHSQMDQLVVSLMDAAPEFYMAYFDARIVVDLRGPGRSPETPAA